MYDIQILRGNIVNVQAEALVNSANNNLMPGNGLNKMIFYSAGDELIDKCLEIGYCATGKAVITKGCNSLSNYIIHAVGPYWHGGYENEARLLASCYVEIMKIVEKKKIKSIAIPAICTGNGKYPAAEAVEIAICTIKSYIEVHKLNVKVVIVCSDNDMLYKYRMLKNKMPDITKYLRRKDIHIEATLDKEEKKMVSTLPFSKGISDKQKSKVLNSVFGKITQLKYKDLVFLPYPYKKEDVNKELCAKYKDRTGPYVTLDCISQFNISSKGVLSFTAVPCAYRFEDEFQVFVELDDSDEQSDGSEYLDEDELEEKLKENNHNAQAKLENADGDFLYSELQKDNNEEYEEAFIYDVEGILRQIKEEEKEE